MDINSIKFLTKDLIMDIQSIGVIGAGQMGRGIAQVAAFSGFNVELFDVSQEAADFGSRIY